MRTKLRHLWKTLSSSYWFIAAIMLLAGFGLAAALLALDRRVYVERGDGRWLYAGGPEARTPCSHASPAPRSPSPASSSRSPSPP